MAAKEELRKRVYGDSKKYISDRQRSEYSERMEKCESKESRGRSNGGIEKITLISGNQVFYDKNTVCPEYQGDKRGNNEKKDYFNTKAAVLRTDSLFTIQRVEKL